MSYHFFKTAMAEKFGVNAAILLENIRYWIDKNRANKKHFHDGLFWTYNSVKAFEELFPYLSAKQIRAALQKLTDGGVIIKGNYNENAYDRTLWYAITPFGEALLQGCETAEPNTENGEAHFTQKANGNAQGGEPIPNNNTNIPPSLSSLHNEEEVTYGKKDTCMNKGKEDKAPPSGEAPKDHEPVPMLGEVMTLYNKICGDKLPHCLRQTASRKRALKARLQEGFTLADFEHAFKNAAKSAFLLGGNDRKWKADFDFLIGTKMPRVLEGSYNNEAKDAGAAFGYQDVKREVDIANGDF